MCINIYFILVDPYEISTKHEGGKNGMYMYMFITIGEEYIIIESSQHWFGY